MPPLQQQQRQQQWRQRNEAEASVVWQHAWGSPTTQLRANLTAHMAVTRRKDHICSAQLSQPSC